MVAGAFPITFMMAMSVTLLSQFSHADELPSDNVVEPSIIELTSLKAVFSSRPDAYGCSTETLNCSGQQPADLDGCSCDDWATRQGMTGTWGGLRPQLREDGITFRGSVTQFGFGVVGGIKNPLGPFGAGDTFEYTGRGEYDLIFNLETLFGLPKGKLVAGFQQVWGQYGNVSLNTGALSSAVFAAALPPTPDHLGTPYLTDFLWMQPLSQELVVFAGKKNVVGSADQDNFAGGDGTNQFANQAPVANPAYLLALPYSSFTAGIILPREWGNASVYVWDPRDRTREGLDFEGVFDDGVILGAQVRAFTDFFDKPGEHHVGAIWKRVDLIDLSQTPDLAPAYPYPPGRGLETIGDSYTIYYGFDQFVRVFPGKPRNPMQSKLPRGWGFFGRASISDGNPTPYRYFLSFGIGGDSRLGNDRGDAFGVGWYFNGLSNDFGPVAKQLFGPQDNTGVEGYYRFQFTPWFAVSPHLQFIRPGIGALTEGDDAFVYGLRVNMNL